GLEPSTPSLPWRFPCGTGVHGRALAAKFVLQIAPSACVLSARGCPPVFRLMYPSGTREALSVDRTSNGASQQLLPSPAVAIGVTLFSEPVELLRHERRVGFLARAALDGLDANSGASMSAEVLRASSSRGASPSKVRRQARSRPTTLLSRSFDAIAQLAVEADGPLAALHHGELEPE